MKRYRVQVFACASDGERISLGIWEGEAIDADDARRKALDTLWDSRLDSASMHAEFKTSDRRENCDDCGEQSAFIDTDGRPRCADCSEET